jgi:hypothetical protein
VTAAKIRQSGAWVDSSLAGQVRVGGVWVDFGPAGGPAGEVIEWPTPPSDTDHTDSATYNLGLEFSVTEAGSWIGNEWNPTPLNNPAPAGGTFYASAWNTGGSSLTTPKSFAAPAGGVKQQVIFDTPIAITTGVSYVAAILLDHYVFLNNAASWNEQSPSGRIHADSGRFRSDPLGNVDFPNTTSDNIYFISPIVVFGS